MLGFVTLWPSGGGRPLAAQLQLNVNQGVMALALNVPIGADGAISIFLSQPGDVIIDAVGYYVAANAPAAADNTLIGLYSLFPTSTADAFLGGNNNMLIIHYLKGCDTLSRWETSNRGRMLLLLFFLMVCAFSFRCGRSAVVPRGGGTSLDRRGGGPPQRSTNRRRAALRRQLVLRCELQAHRRPCAHRGGLRVWLRFEV